MLRELAAFTLGGIGGLILGAALGIMVALVWWMEDKNDMLNSERAIELEDAL